MRVQGSLIQGEWVSVLKTTKLYRFRMTKKLDAVLAVSSRIPLTSKYCVSKRLREKTMRQNTAISIIGIMEKKNESCFLSRRMVTLNLRSLFGRTQKMMIIRANEGEVH